VTRHTVNRRQILSWASAATATSLAGTFARRPLRAAAQATSLEVWINRGAPQGDLIADLVGKYNAELAQNGGTVKWETQNIKEGIDAKLAAAATAGSGFPDLYIGDDSLSWLGRYIQAGWVAPLNPILEQVEFNWDDFLPGTRWQLDGQDYVVNYGPSGFMQYINLDHAKEAGLDLKASPPDSQDALIEWADKILTE